MNNILPGRYNARVGANRINTLDLLNDIFAVLYICGFFWYNIYQNIFWPIQFSFFGLTFINAYINNKKINLLCIWVISFFVFCALTLLWSDHKSYSVLITLVKTTSSACFISTYVCNENKAVVVIKSIILGAIILSSRLLLYTPSYEWGTNRLGAAIGMNENGVGMLLMYGSIMALFLSRKNKAYFIPFTVFAILSFMTGSKKIFFIFFIIVFVYFIEKIDKPLKLIYFVPFALLIYLIYYATFNNEMMYDILGKRIELFYSTIKDPESSNHNGSTYIRMELIRLGLEAFTKHPIIGYGIGNFKYMTDYSTYAHNNYVELLVSTGLIGSIIYYMMPVYLLVKSTLTYIYKNKNIALYMLIIIIIFIKDVGTISYYNDINFITLALSYSMITRFSQRE